MEQTKKSKEQVALEKIAQICDWHSGARNVICSYKFGDEMTGDMILARGDVLSNYDHRALKYLEDWVPLTGDKELKEELSILKKEFSRQGYFYSNPRDMFDKVKDKLESRGINIRDIIIKNHSDPCLPENKEIYSRTSNRVLFWLALEPGRYEFRVPEEFKEKPDGLEGKVTKSKEQVALEKIAQICDWHSGARNVICSYKFGDEMTGDMILARGDVLSNYDHRALKYLEDWVPLTGDKELKEELSILKKEFSRQGYFYSNPRDMFDKVKDKLESRGINIRDIIIKNHSDPCLPENKEIYSRTSNGVLFWLALEPGRYEFRVPEEFKEKPDGLEGKVTIIGFSIATILGLALGANSITGAVIGISKTSSTIMGAILFLGGIAGLYFSKK